MPGVSLGITLPTVGSTAGPTWATNLNTAIQTIIDDIEAQIVTSEININADLDYNGYEAEGLGATQYTAKSASVTGATNTNKLYSVLGDLYWTNEDGTAIQITDGSALDVTSAGGFGGDYGSNGSAVYTESSKKFLFWQNAAKTIPALIDCADILLREDAVSTNAVTLKSPDDLTSGYSFTFPSALPAATYPLTMTTAGVVEPSATLTGMTLAGATTLSGAVTASGATNTFNNGVVVSDTAGINTTIDAFSDTTFTPTIYVSGTVLTSLGGTPSYTTQQGYYCRVGNWIFASVYVAGTGFTALSGDTVSVRGLPGTVDFTSMTQWSGSVSIFEGTSQGWNNTDAVSASYLDAATDEVLLSNMTGGVGGTWSGATDITICFNIAYRTS